MARAVGLKLSGQLRPSGGPLEGSEGLIGVVEVTSSNSGP